MQGKFKISENVDKYIELLQKMNVETNGMIKRAVYPAAGVVVRSIEKSIDGLPRRISTNSMYDVDGVTDKQRRGLKEGVGISRFSDDDGFINVKVGFDGYNEQRSPRWPNGQPNAMIARSIEGGTSWSPKHRFIAYGVRQSKEEALRIIEDNLQEYYREAVKSL